MAHGGTRPGAGRPRGAKNKKTEEQIKAVKEQGLTPLEYLTSVYQNALNEPHVRIDAAKAAAPYVHAKLSSIEMKGEMDTTQRVISAEPISEDEWAKEYGDSLGSAAGATESAD